MLSNAHRETQRYQYKLMNNNNPMINNVAPAANPSGKSIRSMLSAQSVIRLREPYYSSQGNALNRSSGLIRASTYNTHANINSLGTTNQNTNNSTKNICQATHPNKSAYKVAPTKIIGLQPQSKLLSQSSKNIQRRATKIYDSGPINGPNGWDPNVIDSLEQALIKAKNPLSSEELKRYSYKQNSVYEPNLSKYVYQDNVMAHHNINRVVETSATITPTPPPTIRKYSNQTPPSLGQSSTSSQYHMSWKRPRILIDIYNAEPIRKKEADPLIAKPLIPTSTRLSYLKSPRLFSTRQARVQFNRPPIPTSRQHVNHPDYYHTRSKTTTNKLDKCVENNENKMYQTNGKKSIELIPMKIYETVIPLTPMAPLTIIPNKISPSSSSSSNDSQPKECFSSSSSSSSSSTSSTSSNNGNFEPANKEPQQQQSCKDKEGSQQQPLEYYNVINENLVPEDPKSNVENLKLIQQILEDLKDFLESHRKQQKQQQQADKIDKTTGFSSEEEPAAKKPTGLKTTEKDFERKYNQEFNRKLDLSQSDFDYGVNTNLIAPSTNQTQNSTKIPPNSRNRAANENTSLDMAIIGPMLTTLSSTMKEQQQNQKQQPQTKTLNTTTTQTTLSTLRHRTTPVVKAPLVTEPIEEEMDDNNDSLMAAESSSDEHDLVNQELSKIDEEKNKRLSQIPAVIDPKLLSLAKPYSALIQETFTSIDGDNNGLVYIDDAERVLFGFNTRFGKNMSKEEIRAFCQLLDSDADSRIDLEQFSSAFMNCAI